jgi:hypothetical protein
MISSVIFVLILTVVFLVPSQKDRDAYLSICIDKHRILKQTAVPKIIIKGGSGVALGLDSLPKKNEG